MSAAYKYAWLDAPKLFRQHLATTAPGADMGSVDSARKRAHLVAGCRPDSDPLAWIVSEPSPASIFSLRSGALLHDRQIRSERFDARPLGSQASAAAVPTHQAHQTSPGER